MHFEKNFTPAWWLRNRHAQTIWPSKFRQLPLPETTVERLELADGDFLDLHWGGNNQTDLPIVIVLHGLGGSIHSHYIKGILPALTAAGFRGVLIHMRTAAGVINRTFKNYHAGDTEDLRFVVATLKQRFPKTRLAALGYSLGGSMLLNYLGRYQNESLLDTAVVVSVPYDLYKTVRILEHGFARVYQRHVLGCLKQTAYKKYDALRGFIDPARVLKIQNLYEYDALITAPLYGFASADEYYKKCSPTQWLKHIDVPTLLIHAEDDPFMTPALTPSPGHVSDAVQLDIFKHGGHVGFIAGKQPLRPVYWLEQRIPEFLRSVFNTRTV